MQLGSTSSDGGKSQSSVQEKLRSERYINVF